MRAPLSPAPAAARPQPSKRVIAIDPALRNTGYAVLERVPGGRFQALAYGTIKNADKLLQSGCLVAIREQVAALVAQHEPECAAVEGIIYVQSMKTAITMGAARAAAILALAERGLPVYEYAPRRIKQAVVGRGGAEKAQVGFMVKAMVLGLKETPTADAADALAIGLTHFQNENMVLRGVTPAARV